ncbi:conserved hypothetical protein [uncultured Desulfobacterium sp.]|uniref:DUF2357 domain-containing protein n=1 Tax=uncultured Desulfobacterium sp. TaxID=201089 RepID=A0A445MTA2_9BACT|nr:conserved hypothetical protein [uncultured Desulfobacterium sp.]
MTFPLYDPGCRMAIGLEPLSLSEEEIQSADPSSAGEIDENRTFFVRFYGDVIPDFFHSISKKVEPPREFPGNLFEVRFKNMVGLTRLGEVNLRIVNRKIGETLYNAMLTSLTEKVADLVFSLGKITGQSYTKGLSGDTIPYIQFLFLKKYLLAKPLDIFAISGLITANPHRRLLSALERIGIDQATRIDPSSLPSLFSTSNFTMLRPDHFLVDSSLGQRILMKTGKTLFPIEIQSEKKYLTVDTHENRFIKFFLKDLAGRLSDERLRRLPGDSESYLNPSIIQDVAEMAEGIEWFRTASFWAEVGEMHLIPTNSQVLQHRDGYRQLFELYTLLQLATRCDFDFMDFDRLLETKDTATLFEYWCFFVIRDLIERQRKPIRWNTEVVNGPWEKSLPASLTISYEGDVSLSFNRSFGGSIGFNPTSPPHNLLVPSESYSYNYRPDIVVTKGDHMLIFDAKYKGQQNRFYGEDEDGNIRSPNPEDIGKMHTYREAILNVAGAFILYPGADSICFNSHTARQPFQGVGALPLRPNDEGGPNLTHGEALARVLSYFLDED